MSIFQNINQYKQFDEQNDDLQKQKNFLWVPQQQNLRSPDPLIDQQWSGIQKYIRELLKDSKSDIPKIIWDIVDISQNATTATPTWDIIADHKTQLQAKKLLLELAGVYKAKWDTNFNFDLSWLLYSKW